MELFDCLICRLFGTLFHCNLLHLDTGTINSLQNPYNVIRLIPGNLVVYLCSHVFSLFCPFFLSLTQVAPSLSDITQWWWIFMSDGLWGQTRNPSGYTDRQKIILAMGVLHHQDRTLALTYVSTNSVMGAGTTQESCKLSGSDLWSSLSPSAPQGKREIKWLEGNFFNTL